MHLLLVMLFGIGLMIGPPIAEITGHGLGTLMSSILMIVGLVVSLISGFLIALTKLYVKTTANEAFVKTGMGGQRVVQGGGAIIVPFIHEVVRVPLNVFKLEIKRTNEHSMLTHDKLRADIGAEFYLKVEANEDDISAAATAFGNKMNDEKFVANKIEEKLVSVLRTIAATKTLDDLNTKRDEFVKEVSEAIATDLKPNGLTLETATISALDQTAKEHMKENNVFDAEGMKTIARITEQAKTETNMLERKGEQDRKKQDVETRKSVLALERDQAEAEALQQAEVKKVQAENNRQAREKEIEATQFVELREVEKTKMLEVANKQKEQAEGVAAQEKQQAIEVAEKRKLEAIAEAEASKAAKQTAQAEAEEKRQSAQESIRMVEVSQAADRDRQKAIIDAEAKAQQNFIAEQKAADAAAYKIKKDAEARKEAAEADAHAVTKKAEAQRDAQVAQATGQKAIEMVPVDIQQKAVEVERERIEKVVVPELQAREKYGKSQQEFELNQARIEAAKDVETARAQASVEIFKRVEIKAYGTVADVTGVTKSVMQGEQIAELFNSLTSGVKGEAIEKIAETAGEIVKSARSSQVAPPQIQQTKQKQTDQGK